MIIGIGTDIIEISRISCLPTDDIFFRSVFSCKELELAELSASPYRFFAERFAVKEAVFKALGTNGDHIRLNEIETLNGDNGAPFVKISGNLRKLADSKGVKSVLISLSQEENVAIAFVVITDDYSISTKE